MTSSASSKDSNKSTFKDLTDNTETVTNQITQLIIIKDKRHSNVNQSMVNNFWWHQSAYTVAVW